MNFVKILLIGTNRINLLTIRGLLLDFDEEWQIEEKSFDVSINELNSVNYDLILIDCEESTPELYDKIVFIKQSNKNWGTPVLVCMQQTEAARIKEVLEAGALDFVTKPFKSIELFARVRTGLTLSSSVRKLEKQASVIRETENKEREVISGLIPEEIVKELTIFGESRPKKYREASVLFVDMVDFTRKSTKLSPKILIDELSEIFAGFDEIIKKHRCTRIKTMGDGYLAVSGIPTPSREHAANLINVAIEIRNFLKTRNETNAVQWESKIGINSGEVIGSVLGKNNLLFDVFGETVNAASRMEKACESNQINVSKSTYMLTRNKFKYVERLPNEVKGLGVKSMYYVRAK